MRPISSKHIDTLTLRYLENPNDPLYQLLQLVVRYNLPVSKLATVLGVSRATTYKWIQSKHPVRVTDDTKARVIATLDKMTKLENAGALAAADWFEQLVQVEPEQQ